MTQSAARPNPFDPAFALSLWRAAQAQEVGIRFAVDQKDIEKIKPTMYKVRKDHPELADLMLCVAPGAEELWIVKRPKEAP